MGKLIVHNGDFVKPENIQISLENRAMNYADGLFESIRVVNGKLYCFDEHFARLEEGAKLLKLEANYYTLKDILRLKASLLAERLFMHKGGKIKILISRRSGGLYLPESNAIDYIITGETLQENLFALNPTGLNVDVFTDFHKPIHPFSKYKFLAKEISVLARIDAEERGFDDGLLLNTEGKIIEASSSNVFLVYDDNTVVTPGLESGCLAGIMRMNVINACIRLGLKVYEQPLTSELLLQGKEIFLTNAIQGIRYVGSFKSKRYFKQVSEVILNAVNAQVRIAVKSNELF
jgi:branched-chain amino acid aminotransferase